MDFESFVTEYQYNIDYIINIIDIHVKERGLTYQNKKDLMDYIVTYIYNNSKNTIKDKEFLNIIGTIGKDDYYILNNIGFFEDLHYFIKKNIGNDEFMYNTNSSEFAMIILSYCDIIDYESDDDNIEYEENYYNDFL